MVGLTAVQWGEKDQVSGVMLEGGDQRPKPPNRGYGSFFTENGKLPGDATCCKPLLSKGIRNKNMGVEEAEKEKKNPGGKWSGSG